LKLVAVLVQLMVAVVVFTLSRVTTGATQLGQASARVKKTPSVMLVASVRLYTVAPPPSVMVKLMSSG